MFDGVPEQILQQLLKAIVVRGECKISTSQSTPWLTVSGA
jgi:hypothetical protein